MDKHIVVSLTKETVDKYTEEGILYYNEYAKTWFLNGVKIKLGIYDN